jgi:hypothetical protein
MLRAVENGRWCHASCCSGETEYSGPYCSHDAQLFLDELGYPCGYFGEYHDKVLEIIVAARGRVINGAFKP